MLVAVLSAFRFPPLTTARVWLPLCAVLYVLVPVLQGAIEGFASWLDPDRLLVNGSLLAIAASLFLVDRLRVRR
ncbi:MAG TPA: PepSY domain-containing protein, partial [Alcanivorax sp.]|nr:PepSY domain-containing protein [Alcanivorax sp.]